MLVHFASGPHPFPPPWHNIDYVASTAQVDQVVNLLAPLPENLAGIRIAYIGHFMEHITPEEGVDLLRRIRERMAPDGHVMIVGPDAVKGWEWYSAGRLDAGLMHAIRKHGEPQGDYRGGCHMWDCTGEAVVAQLTEAGWADAEEFPLHEMPDRYPEIPMINAGEWQFAATARR